jgi:hypothetical protein
MPCCLITTYATLSRGGSGAPPPPLQPPQEPALPRVDEKEDTDGDEFFADLPTDVEAEEAAAEQRAILASFETRRRDETAQQFMAAERRAGAAMLADAHATARSDIHRRNIETARAAMAKAEQHLAQADRVGGLATVAAECPTVAKTSTPSFVRPMGER